MADLFGNRGFWQDSGCLSTEKKEGKTEDSDLVLICFQISVWSGTTTEQTSIEEGAEFMKRRRIIPGVMLKPFLDFRARAKLCVRRWANLISTVSLCEGRMLPLQNEP